MSLSHHLATNVRRLREARGFSQQRAASASGIPRPTWTSLESGAANPTLGVLSKAAAALGVSIEELIGPPRAEFAFYPANSIKRNRKQGATLRPLIPEALPGLQASRTELAPGSQLIGIPHKQGTREYLYCEQGEIDLLAAGKKHRLSPGDVLVFAGDQNHSYRNPAIDRVSISISIVCFAAPPT